MTSSMPPIISEYFECLARPTVRCRRHRRVLHRRRRRARRGPGVARSRRRSGSGAKAVATAYEYTVECIGSARLGEVDGVERHDVYTHLEGNFPGGTSI